MNFYPKDGVNMEKYYKDSYGSIENLISLAKNSSNVTAQADLGTAYSEGVENFAEKDVEKAIGWLNTAVDNGCVLPFILTRLGALQDGKGAPHYQRKAYEMYHREAKLGCAQSQLYLAEMYRCGVEGVVNKDIKEAFEWYKKAAGESEVEATDRLVAGTIKTIENVRGGEARKQALTLLHKYYLDGDCPEGRPQPTKAVYYLTRAAELGDTEAQLRLGEIYLIGNCEQIKDVKKAKRWLGKAAASGDVMASQVTFRVQI